MREGETPQPLKRGYDKMKTNKVVTYEDYQTWEYEDYQLYLIVIDGQEEKINKLNGKDFNLLNEQEKFIVEVESNVIQYELLLDSNRHIEAIEQSI